MSHFIDLQTRITNRLGLIKALCRLGYPEGKIENHDQLCTVKGYYEDRKGHVIVRMKDAGTRYGDIGFELTKDGTYKIHVDDLDINNLSRNGRNWVDMLSTYYGVEVAKLTLKKQGLKYTEDVDDQERPRIKVRMESSYA